MKALAATLRARRLELGISLSDLAKDIGISAILLRKFEAGERPLTLAMFPLYAQALDMDIRQVCLEALQQLDPAFYACLLGAPVQLQIEGLPEREMHGRALVEVREEDAFWMRQLDEANSTTRRCVRDIVEQLLKTEVLPTV